MLPKGEKHFLYMILRCQLPEISETLAAQAVMSAVSSPLTLRDAHSFETRPRGVGARRPLTLECVQYKKKVFNILTYSYTYCFKIEIKVNR